MRRKKIIAAALLAAAVAAQPLPVSAATPPMVGSYDDSDDGGTGPALDDGQTAEPEETISREELEDGVLEYREIGSRIENYNNTYKDAKSGIVNGALNLDGARALAQEASEVMEDAMDLKSADMDEEDRALYESYKQTAQAMRKQAQSMTNEELPSKYQRTLRQTKNQLTRGVQGALIQYQTLLAQAELADKNVELAAAGVESRGRMVQLGMSSNEDALAAQKSLYEAQNNAAQIHAGLEKARQSILILLGWDADSPVEIARIPEPDLNRLASMNLERDKAAAIGANYDLMSIRSTSAAGSSARSSKKRNVSMTEQTVASQVEMLYAQVISQKQAYDAAQSSFAAAQQTMDGADRQYALGMIGKTEYLGAQVSYLKAKSDRESASMGLFKAMEDYDWAVKGLIESNGG